MASFYKLTRYVLIEKKPFWVEADYSNSPYAKKFPIKKSKYLVKRHSDKRFYSIVNADDNSYVVEVDYSDILKYSRPKTHLVKHHPNKRFYEAIRDDEEGLLFLEKKYCKILKEPE